MGKFVYNSRTFQGFQGLLTDTPMFSKDYKLIKNLIYNLKFYYENATLRLTQYKRTGQ